MFRVLQCGHARIGLDAGRKVKGRTGAGADRLAKAR